MRILAFSSSFWTLYTLGFTIALPTFLYYNINFGARPGESATVAFLYLGLGILIWLVALLLYGRFFIKQVFTDKRRLETVAKEGLTILAKVTDRIQVGTYRDTTVLDLKLEFTNLAGVRVEMPYQLNDSKPHENRYQIGDTIEMSVSLDGRNSILIPKNIQIVHHTGIVLMYSIILLLLLAAAVIYPIFSYKLESQGSGWRFLTFYHPWILVPLINIAVFWLINVFFSYIGRASGDPEQPLRMILYGIKTTGTILNYSLTGMYINEQPRVQFEIGYTDHQGIKRKTTYKKIISLLDLHKIGTGTKEIMYLPTKPENIVFYEDLTL